MTKKILAAVFLVTVCISGNKTLQAQDAVVQEGEFGIGVGAGHYFGDLNTRAKFNRAKVAASIFFRKNLGNYIALRVGASFAQLGYSDKYNTHNQYMLERNLSFNSKVWELTLQGDFNFSGLCLEIRHLVLPLISLLVPVYSATILMLT
ncbi:MAG: hypothetical protein IPG86_18950 [Chitinophagaceae bacterium]|nr:hypothetical protein [Chitinophagaceae bacterium]